MSPGEQIDVPGFGRGVLIGFRGKFEGGRDWLYMLVRFSATVSALVPVYEGIVRH